MLEFLPEPAAEALAEQMVAFANAVGGTIILGMDTQGNLYAQAAEDLEPIFERALALCEPRFRPADLPQWEVEDTPAGPVVAIHVRPTPHQMHTACGELYVRSGTLNVRLEPDELRRKAYSTEAPALFEDGVLPGATVEDLDGEIIEEYQRHRLERGPRGESFTRFALLRDAGAIDSAGQPTMAGMLLFGHSPQHFMPQVGIVIVRFKGTSLHKAVTSQERYARRVEVVGPAARVIEKTWEVLFEEIEHQPLVQGLERRERFAYPVEAVREVIVNAVCHRDYSITGQRIEVRLFDDRLEVMSPGGLPGHMTLDNILDEHYSRNPRLVRGLYYWGYIEELGQGIDIIYEAMRREHHPEPEFRDTGRAFTVILRNAVDDLEAEFEGFLNPRQIRALHFLQRHDRITNRQYQQLCPEVSTETLRLDLRDMVEKGLLLKVGDKRGTCYVRK